MNIFFLKLHKINKLRKAENRDFSSNWSTESSEKLTVERKMRYDEKHRFNSK